MMQVDCPLSAKWSEYLRTLVGLLVGLNVGLNVGLTVGESVGA